MSTVQQTETELAAEAKPRRTANGKNWTSIGNSRTPATMVVLRYAVLIVAALGVLIPLVWAVLSSFKTQAELGMRPPTLLPEAFTLANYTEAISRFDFTRYLFNSVVVTIGATLLTVVINTMCAYGLAKYNFRGRDFLFVVVLAMIMVRFRRGAVARRGRLPLPDPLLPGA